jgi:predicted DCC family thiol-disulfide oxidoreductase YuxK
MNKLELYYDGSCPLCVAEIKAIRAVDTGGELVFTDCAAAGFDEASTLRSGVSKVDLMRELHAREVDGVWYRGVDAFVQLYRRAGLPQIARFWAHPVSRILMGRLYPWIARNRYWLSRFGLPGLTATVIRFYAARAQRRSKACATGACSID